MAFDHQNDGHRDDHRDYQSIEVRASRAGSMSSGYRGNLNDQRRYDYRGNQDDRILSDCHGNQDDLPIEGNVRQRIWTSCDDHHVTRGNRSGTNRSIHRARTTAFLPEDDQNPQAYPRRGALKRDGSRPQTCRCSNAKAHRDGHHLMDVRRTACALNLHVNYLLLASPFPSMCPTVGALSPQTPKATRRWPLLKKCPAASYSPTQSPVQYHRR